VTRKGAAVGSLVRIRVRIENPRNRLIRRALVCVSPAVEVDGTAVTADSNAPWTHASMR
jgi:hypothetical protein